MLDAVLHGLLSKAAGFAPKYSEAGTKQKIFGGKMYDRKYVEALVSFVCKKPCIN